MQVLKQPAQLIPQQPQQEVPQVHQPQQLMLQLHKQQQSPLETQP